MKLPKVLGMLDPSAFKGAVNLVERLPEATSRRPGLLGVVCCNWLRIEAGTVNVFCPAVVRQMNVDVLVTALLPVPEVAEVEPMISTRSEALPPVQLTVSPALRVTVLGKPPVTVSGEARVIELLNVPTSLPPAPLKA